MTHHGTPAAATLVGVLPLVLTVAAPARPPPLSAGSRPQQSRITIDG
jgi:hypothetical protein